MAVAGIIQKNTFVVEVRILGYLMCIMLCGTNHHYSSQFQSQDSERICRC